jgi:hypothetical protein
MKESFVRWQGIAITQLGYAVNLILGFATASLGFSLTLLRDEHFTPQHSEKGFFDLLLVLLGLSLLFGILCVINRLRDFRQTRDIARDRERLKDKGMNDVQIKEALKQRRDDVENLGKWTWRFFWFQLASFSLGVLALVLVFASVYRNKLGF